MAQEIEWTLSQRTAPGSAETHSLTTLAPGTRISKYEIIEVLGQGGFGITYRAIDTQLDREVAIKEYLPASFAVRGTNLMVLPRSTQVTDDFRWGRERFLTEAKTLARFDKVAGIVNVYDFLEAYGTAYMVMGLVSGETLEGRLKRERRLSESAIEQLLHPLLDGLEKVHAANFLHRDIKPANILIDPEGQPTLIDFGASRAALQGRTQAMTAIYTPGYAAFEQFTSAPQGPWTDIYALGATLYHCVTGAPPPSASDRMIEDNLVPAVEAGKGRYAPSLLAVVDAALKLTAAERPQTVADWRRRLSASSPSMLIEPVGPLTRRMESPVAVNATPRRLAQSRRAAWALLFLSVAGVAAAGGYVWHRVGPTAVQPEPEVKTQASAESARGTRETADRQATEERARAEARRQADEDRARSDAKRQADERAMEQVAADKVRQEAEAKQRAEEAERQRLAGAEDRRKASEPVDPVAAKAALVRGNQWMGQRMWERAIAEYDKAISLDQTSKFAFLNRGAARYALGLLPQAVEDYSEAIRLDGGYASALYARGLAYRKLGRSTEAAADIDAARAINSGIDRQFADPIWR